MIEHFQKLSVVAFEDGIVSSGAHNTVRGKCPTSAGFVWTLKQQRFAQVGCFKLPKELVWYELSRSLRLTLLLCLVRG
jgi:hypothetical protein